MAYGENQHKIKIKNTLKSNIRNVFLTSNRQANSSFGVLRGIDKPHFFKKTPHTELIMPN
jgi:hypothetical protein